MKFNFKKNMSKRKKKEKKPSKIVTWWLNRSIFFRKSVIAVSLTMVLTVFFVGMAFTWYAFIYLDDEFDLSYVDNSLDYTTVIYAKDDSSSSGYKETERLYKDENRIWVDLEKIPENLKWAFIAIEDKRFYSHSGVDLKRTMSAIFNFFKPGSSSTYGGSTITQQLIKNLTGDDDVKISRKIQEIRRAWYLEKEYRKDQILEVYLNTIYLSQNCNGVQTAANVYFGKDVSELTLEECACIAAITKYPSKYDPIKNPEKNKERQETVLNEMAKMGKITQKQADAAKKKKLVFSKSSEKKTKTSKQSYFVDAVIEDIISDLMKQKGYSKVYATNLVYSGGLQIYSTMNTKVQAAMDEVYQDSNSFPTLWGETQPQSAMVIIDNATGSIAGMVGGRGEKTNRGLNRATQTYRQPGSSIKPIGTYAPAIEYSVDMGSGPISPSTVIEDSYAKPEIQWPKNYYAGFRGNMTVNEAVANSVNTIAAKINLKLGARRSFDFMKDNLGITSLVDSTDNPSVNDLNAAALSLGGLTKGVSVKEITAAYAAFPNEGTYTKPYSYTKVLDSNGKVILENQIETKTAMTAQTAAIMNQMLSYACTAGTGSVANFGSTQIAGKTGTTNDDKDRWFVGYTSYYTAAVWFGYDTPREIVYSGINPAANAWKQVMSKVHSGLPYKSFVAPTNMVSCKICAETGLLATDACEKTLTGQYTQGSQPTKVCEKHKKIEKKPTDKNKKEENETEENKKEENNLEENQNEENQGESDTGQEQENQ